MEIENCQIRGQALLGSQYWVKNPIDKEADDIQARLPVARDTERQVRSDETKSEAKVGYRKTEA